MPPDLFTGTEPSALVQASCGQTSAQVMRNKSILHRNDPLIIFTKINFIPGLQYTPIDLKAFYINAKSPRPSSQYPLAQASLKSLQVDLPLR
jgi:hypothetical protein